MIRYEYVYHVAFWKVLHCEEFGLVFNITVKRHNLLCWSCSFRRQVVRGYLFVRFTFYLDHCHAHVSEPHSWMKHFMFCAFYMSSGGWEGKTFHLGNAPQIFAPTQTCGFTHPKNCGGEIDTCLKQSISFELAFMRSIWEATKNLGSKDRSDLERFEISPCLPVATKRPRAVQSTAVMFSHVLTAVYFKFEMFCFA